MKPRETATIMTHYEMARIVQKEACIPWQMLDLAFWEPTMREGYALYMTNIGSMDLVVWRDHGHLLWRCTKNHWIQEDHLDHLETYLREHGFQGDRIDDVQHRTVIFRAHRGKARLHVHLLHHLSTQEKDIEALASSLLVFEAHEAHVTRLIHDLGQLHL